MAQEGLFWELVPENVIEIPAERNSTDFGRECGGVVKTKWKGRREDRGQSLNAIQERYS